MSPFFPLLLILSSCALSALSVQPSDGESSQHLWRKLRSVEYLLGTRDRPVDASNSELSGCDANLVNTITRLLEGKPVLNVIFVNGTVIVGSKGGNIETRGTTTTLAEDNARQPVESSPEEEMVNVETGSTSGTEEQPTALTSCLTVQSNGVYLLKFGNITKRAYCDCDFRPKFSTDSICWLVVQRRINRNVDFGNKHWRDYKEGFGLPSGDYWLGLDALHEATLTAPEMHMVYNDVGVTQELDAPTFRIGDEASAYKIIMPSTDIIPSNEQLFLTADAPFSTSDRDNTDSLFKPAQLFGAYWYGKRSSMVFQINQALYAGQSTAMYIKY